MAKDDGEELLKRARGLRQQIRTSVEPDQGPARRREERESPRSGPVHDPTTGGPAKKGDGAVDPLEQLAWAARQLHRLRQIILETRFVLGKLAPLFRPLVFILGPLWRAFRSTLIYASCHPDETGARTLSGFSPKRLATSMAVALGALIVFGSFYVYGTRERGRFIISNYHLIDARSDTYQLGGCPKFHGNQTECEPGSSEIMLVAPDWLSTVAHLFGVKEGVLGIDALQFAEIAGGIPQQGECVLSRYGVYFRPPPFLRFLRGTTKRHVVHVGTCEIYGIRQERRKPDPAH